MARIAGVELPVGKRVDVGLTYIYGIGSVSACDILRKVGVAPETRVKDLQENEVVKLRETIDKEYVVEGDLRKDVTMGIKRLMEIGIRKVLGAGTSTLIRLLSMEIVRLIFIATLISWPLAYLATYYWLQNFANRIEIDLSVYVVSTLAVVIVVSLAISFQTIRVALSNPIDSLRQE